MIIFNNNSIGYVLDTDASKVIEAVRSTGVTITPAMMHYAHYLISNMKNIGTWQLSNAVYGFVGGTAASHKFNWKDLRDVDAAFRLQFNGTFTHSNNGVTGVSAINSGSYANTFLIPNTTLSANSTHFSFYFRTSLPISNSFVIGCINSTTSRFAFYPYAFNVGYISDFYNDTTGRLISTVNINSKGILIANRSSSSNHNIFKDSAKIATSSTSGGSLPTVPIYLFAYNENGIQRYSNNNETSFTSIGAGLTDIQAIQQSQIVTNAQNILNRA